MFKYYLKSLSLAIRFSIYFKPLSLAIKFTYYFKSLNLNVGVATNCHLGFVIMFNDVK
jgi:hypothetical protein